MKVLESCHRVVRLSQIPYFQARILVIIISNHELSRYLRVPCHTGLSEYGLLTLPLRPLIIAEIIEIVLTLSLLLTRLCEIEYGFVDLEVPDDDLSIFGGTGQDVRYHAVPADGSDARSLVEVGHARLEVVRLLDVVLDVLDQHL
jgi:hypothetical protein